MPFELPDLPYPYDALEPHIGAETMRIHHDLHHKAYVDNANAALDGTEWAERLGRVGARRPRRAPRGQAHRRPQQRRRPREPLALLADHEPGRRRRAAGDLAAAINDVFGGFAELKTAVNDGGVKRFGSGWTWLVWDGTGLAVYSTPNQDSPILQSDVPLLGIDVWEHAYYLKYQNKRPAYLEAWWNVVNWDEVARQVRRGARVVGPARLCAYRVTA